MRYIVVSRDNLSVNLVEDHPEAGFIVPVRLKPLYRELSPLEDVIYHEILYPAKHEENKIRYPGMGQTGIRTGYKLIEPPPWMIAMAYIMWEAITQDLDWAAVRTLVRSAMAELATLGVAPGEEEGQTRIHGGFAWAKYSIDEKKQRDLFIGLKRIYGRMSEEQRRDVANSVIVEEPASA